MKAVLLLCLLAFISCEKDIFDIGKCIYKAPKVQELINDVIVAIATQDFSKLLPKVKEALPDLIKVVLGCLTDTKAIEDETKLENIFQSIRLTPQSIRHIIGLSDVCPKDKYNNCMGQCTLGENCGSYCNTNCLDF